MELLVLGGTGLAGRAVCDEARRRGHGVRVVARHEPETPLRRGVSLTIGDTTTGAGLAEATAGVGSVIDCTNIVTFDRATATAFFVESVRKAAAAAADAGVGRYVLLSIVGVDRVPMAYYEAKHAQEQALIDVLSEATCRPVLVRTTQFHDFAAQMLQRSSMGPLVLVPSMRIRPVDLDAVARHLVSMAEDCDEQMAPELAGPREETLPDMVRQYCRATGANRAVIPLRLPGRAGQAVRAGALIPRGGVVDSKAFTEWLGRAATARADVGRSRGRGASKTP